MLRAFIAIVLLAANIRAQNAARPSPDEQLAEVNQLLERGRTSEAERLLRQLIPKPEEDPAQDFGIFTPTGFHDVLWAMVGNSFLGANDYADAERVTAERLRAAEAKGPAAAGHVPIFLLLLAEVQRLQGKHAAAFPLYVRLYRLWLDNQLPADFQKRAEQGYVECLMVRGETAAAELVSRPAVNPDGSAVGPSFHEDSFNTYAVAMEEAGHKSAATELETKIDTEGRRPPSANQQDRDLLRARLMSARKQDAAAEVIYRKWTAYWKTANLPAGMDPKESLQIRTVALAAYTHFLSVRGRAREAQTIQSQLSALGCRFGMCE
jgi:ATP/maltotriose-dependent transcriptional regulator MalT